MPAKHFSKNKNLAVPQGTVSHENQSLSQNICFELAQGPLKLDFLTILVNVRLFSQL